MRRAKGIVVILLIAAAVFAGGCARKKEATVSTEQVRKAEGYPVEVQKASIRSLSRKVHFTGTVELPDEVAVLPLVGGIVKEVYVDKGDHVAANTPMLLIERTDYANGVAQAAAMVQMAQAQRDLASFSRNNKDKDGLRHNEWQMCMKSVEAAREGVNAIESGISAAQAGLGAAKAANEYDNWNLQRMENLYKAGVVSEQQIEGVRTQEKASARQVENLERQIDNLRAQKKSAQKQQEAAEIQCEIADEGPKDLEVKAADAQLAQARAALAGANTALGRTTVNAEVAGTVSFRMAKKGQIIGPGAPAFQIIRDGEKKISIMVSQEDLPFVKTGQEVAFGSTSRPGRRFTATITYVAPFVIASNREAMVEAIIDEGQDGIIEIRHGMFVEGDIILESEEMLAVPYKSILENEIIWIADKDNKAEKRICREHIRLDDYIIIKDGCVKPGDAVVVKGQNLLAENSRVKIVKEHGADSFDAKPTKSMRGKSRTQTGG